MIKFSIIIPVFNIENYLIECIESILKQKYLNYEIILINDGSSDGSGEICDRYAKDNSNIKVIHKKNGGLSSARNEGINNSIGEYIIFIDGDDFISDECLEEIAYICDNKKVDLICGKIIKYYDKSKQIEDKFTFDYKKTKDKTGIEVLQYFFEDIPAIMWSACRTIYRREFLIENKFKFKEGITSEDLQLIPQIYIKAKSVEVYNRPFYYYRQLRPNSIVNTINKKRFFDIVEIINEYLIILDRNEFSESFKNLFIRQLANIYARYVAIISSSEKKDKKEIICEMKKIKYILKYSNNIRGKYLFISTKIFGLYLSSYFYNSLKILIKNNCIKN